MLRRLPLVLVLLALLGAGWMLKDAVLPEGDAGLERDEMWDEIDGPDERATTGEVATPEDEEWDAAARLMGPSWARERTAGDATGAGAAAGAAAATSPGAVVKFGGTVRAPGGASAAGITLKIQGIDGGFSQSVETGPSGRFTLEVPAGRYHLLFSGEGVGGLRIANYLVDGAKGTDLEFDLKRAVRFEVAVKREGTGVEAAEVSVVPVQGIGGEVQKTDVEGLVVFEELVAGKYSLAVEMRAREKIGRQLQLARDQTLAIDIPVGVILHGQVQSKDEGSPVEGADVRTIVRGSSGTYITVSAVSEADGRFEMEVPRGKVLRFEAVADAFAPWPERKKIRQALKMVAPLQKGKAVEVTISLERGLLLTGQVTNPDGEGVEGIELSFRPRRGLPLSARTDADGYYELRGVRPDRYVGAILTEGWFNERPLKVVVPKLASGEAHTYDVVVHPTISVGGVVLLANKRTPAAGARVWITGGGNVLRAAHHAGRVLETFTDPNGAWRITDLPPNMGVATRASLGALEARPRGFRTDAIPKDPIRLILAPTVLLKGQVLDLVSRQPVARARVDIVPQGKPGGRTASRVQADAEGRFEAADLIPGTWAPVPSAGGYLKVTHPETVDLDKNDDERSVTVYLDPGLAIAGVVTDLQGRPLKNTRVTVSGENRAGKRARRDGRTNARGEFRYTGLEPGTYRVWARRNGYRTSALKDLQGGEDRLTIQLRPRKPR